MKKLIVIAVLFAAILSSCHSDKNKQFEQDTVIDTTQQSEENTDNSDTENQTEEENVSQSDISQNPFWINMNKQVDTICEQPPEFLSEENKELFKAAEYIYYNFWVSSSFVSSTVGEENESVDIQNGNSTSHSYVKTDYSYDDFKNYILSVYTDTVMNKLINETQQYMNYNSYLCYIDGARGTNIFYKDKTFELVEQTEDKIVFKAIANYSCEGMFADEEEMKKIMGENAQTNWTEEYNFQMDKTENGWRVSKFEYWK